MIPRAERTTINKEFTSLDEFIHEYVTNVSTSGAFIRSKDPLPVGTLVNLRFTIILDELEVIEGTGEVVRVQQDPPGMGVIFRDLTPASHDVIHKLLLPTLLPPEAVRRQILGIEPTLMGNQDQPITLPPIPPRRKTPPPPPPKKR